MTDLDTITTNELVQELVTRMDALSFISINSKEELVMCFKGNHKVLLSLLQAGNIKILSDVIKHGDGEL